MQNCCVESPGKIIRHKHSGNSNFPGLVSMLQISPLHHICQPLLRPVFACNSVVGAKASVLCVVQGIALGVWKFGLFVLCMLASCNYAAKGFGLVSG
ncbi:hypothetical protein L195_g006484 [Trifolium pratense]|uniref:Uncharacterized protein n=1 Tax=Trifolium pratense TaxID=57577 RepID=A0A2K3P3V0_TRIPR|nr:hypothetical protein L195_g006484 [Trifolium pratense]